MKYKNLVLTLKSLMTRKPLTLKTVFVPTLMLALLALPLSSSAATFLTSDLQVGSRGAQVSELQLFLAADASIYPEAKVTGYFGMLTKAAVMRFQARYGISTVGRVGPQTRAKINALGGLGESISANVTGDVNAPMMSAVAVSYATTSVNANASTTTSVSWATNENARAKLFVSGSPILAAEANTVYGEPSLSGQVYADPSFSLIHAFPLSNLAPNALYYYRAMSIDASGNVSLSSQGSFMTGR